MLTIFKKQYAALATIITFIALVSLHLAFNFSLSSPLPLWENEAPFSRWFALTFPHLLSLKLFTFLVSLIIIAFQAYLVNIISNSVRQIEEYSLLFSWLYIWVIHAFPEFHSFSPQLISSTLLLTALYIFLKNLSKTSYTHYFYIGFLVGFAILFSFSAVLMIVLFLILQILYSSLKLKSGIIAVISALVIVIDFYLFQYFINNQIFLTEDLKRFIINGPAIKQLAYYQIIPMLLLLISIAIGVVNSLSLSNKINQNARLFLNLTLSILIILSFGIFMNSNSFIYSLVPVLFSVSVYLSLNLNIFKRPIYNELIHLIVLSLIVINHISYSIVL